MRAVNRHLPLSFVCRPEDEAMLAARSRSRKPPTPKASFRASARSPGISHSWLKSPAGQREKVFPLERLPWQPILEGSGALGGIRTHGPRIRKAVVVLLLFVNEHKKHIYNKALEKIIIQKILIIIVLNLC
jgi:hypothetical protein